MIEKLEMQSERANRVSPSAERAQSGSGSPEVRLCPYDLGSRCIRLPVSGYVPICCALSLLLPPPLSVRVSLYECWENERPAVTYPPQRVRTTVLQTGPHKSVPQLKSTWRPAQASVLSTRMRNAPRRLKSYYRSLKQK